MKLPAGRYSGNEIKKFSIGYDSHIDKDEASAIFLNFFYVGLCGLYVSCNVLVPKYFQKCRES